MLDPGNIINLKYIKKKQVEKVFFLHINCSRLVTVKLCATSQAQD